MQRVSAFLPTWEKRNSNASAGASSTASGGGSGGGGGGLFGWPNRSSSRNSTASTSGLNGGANLSQRPAKLSIASVNSNARIQREAFWPATLDEECDKAARILKSFCCTSETSPPSSTTFPGTTRVPTQAIEQKRPLLTCASRRWIPSPFKPRICIALSEYRRTENSHQSHEEDPTKDNSKRSRHCRLYLHAERSLDDRLRWFGHSDCKKV